MRRDFNVPKGLYGTPGDQEANQKGAGLAQIADGAMIEKLIQSVSMLDLFGGQLYIQAVRAKIDAEGQIIPDAEAKATPGQWETVGYVFRFDTVDAEVMRAAENAFVVDGPIETRPSDDRELARKVGLGQANGASPNGAEPAAAPADVEEDLRDEIEAEAG